MRKLKENNTITINEAKEEFITDCKLRNLSERTVKWYSDTIRLVFKDINVKYIDKVTSEDIKTHILEQKKLNKTANTINGRIRALKSFFSYLSGQGICENIMSNISTLKEKQQKIIPLSLDKIRKLLSIPDKNTFSGLRDYTIMSLMLDTGLRVSEVTGIRKKDINIETNGIFVTGKGNKERIVPIGNLLKKEIINYLRQVSDLSDEDYIFITVHDNVLDRHRLYKRIKDCGEKANIKNVRVSPHTFRHTFAINYLKNGGNIYYLQSILGHSTLDMVKKYLQCIDDDVISAHNQFSPLDSIRKKRR